MTILSAASGERACALLCAALVFPFAFLVLLDGSVAPVEYLRLTAAFLGIAAMMLATAFVVFAVVEMVKAGQRSGWKASPTGAIAAAIIGRWRADRFATLVWPMALFLVLLPSFNAFKQRILPRAGFDLDPELAAIDRLMFGGDPGLILHQLVGSPLTTRVFDAIYHGWFVPTTLGICVIGLCAQTRTRAQYMLAYAAVWILLGAIFAFLLPAAGPAFYGGTVELR